MRERRHQFKHQMPDASQGSPEFRSVAVYHACWPMHTLVRDISPCLATQSGNLTFTLRVEQPHPPAPPAPPAGPLPALQQQQQQAGQAQQQQQQRGHAEVQLPASTRSADAPITPHVIELRSGMTLPRESTAAGQGTAVGAAGTAGAAAGQGTVVSTAGTAGATAGQRQEKPGLARRLCGWMLPGGAKGQEGELVGDGDTVHVDILPYKIVVPPLEVRQPPPGSKEHELYAGQDF